MIDTLDQTTRRAFEVTKVILSPLLYTMFYRYAIAYRPFLAESHLYEGTPVVCDTLNRDGVRLEIQLRPEMRHVQG